MSVQDNDKVILPDFVLVNPKLEDDPALKQGQIGSIMAVMLNTDEFYLGFDDKTVGTYSADALLMFKHPEEIHDFLQQNAGTISGTSFIDIKLIMDLLCRETETHLKAALSLAGMTRELTEATTIGLDEYIGLKQSHRIGR